MEVTVIIAHILFSLLFLPCANKGVSLDKQTEATKKVKQFQLLAPSPATPKQSKRFHPNPRDSL